MSQNILRIFYTILIVSVLFSLKNCKDEEDDKLKPEILSFSLYSPVNNSTDMSLTPSLVWNTVRVDNPYNVHPYYHVKVIEEASGLIVVDTIVSDKDYQSDSLNFFTDYQWQVVAYVSDQDSIESQTWSFKTEYNDFDGDVVLDGQSEVNEFGAHGYKRINGDLWISSYSDPVYDFSPLNTIEKIDGDLYMSYFSGSVFCFDSLKIIGGELNLKLILN